MSNSKDDGYDRDRDVANEGQRALRAHAPAKLDLAAAMNRLADIAAESKKDPVGHVFGGEAVYSLMPTERLLKLLQEKDELLADADRKAMEMVAKARVHQVRVTHQHREAFMLMTYRTEGGAFEKKIWNSRDGVTPFIVHIDGQAYQHVIAEMTGPFYDRPEGCIAQWETRTEAAMMTAWRRRLERALLAGHITKEKANELADNVLAAQGNHMSIGMRSMVTGRFTDED
jgi:hypothetical protein